MTDPATTQLPVDRFKCRREGHVPALRITSQTATTEKGATYLTSCVRCGELIEEPMSVYGPQEQPA